MVNIRIASAPLVHHTDPSVVFAIFGMIFVIPFADACTFVFMCLFQGRPSPDGILGFNANTTLSCAPLLILSRLPSSLL